MSTRVIRTISDFSRHRIDIDVRCYCGHAGTLAYGPVVARFIREGWPGGLDAALGRFRCSMCGSRPKWIGPLPR